MYQVDVYSKEPYEKIDSFMLKAASQLDATIEAANRVRTEYDNATVGKIIKVFQ